VQKTAKVVLAHGISLLHAGVLVPLLLLDGCRRPLGRRMLR